MSEGRGGAKRQNIDAEFEEKRRVYDKQLRQVDGEIEEIKRQLGDVYTEIEAIRNNEELRMEKGKMEMQRKDLSLKKHAIKLEKNEVFARVRENQETVKQLREIVMRVQGKLGDRGTESVEKRIEETERGIEETRCPQEEKRLLTLRKRLEKEKKVWEKIREVQKTITAVREESEMLLGQVREKDSEMGQIFERMADIHKKNEALENKMNHDVMLKELFEKKDKLREELAAVIKRKREIGEEHKVVWNKHLEWRKRQQERREKMQRRYDVEREILDLNKQLTGFSIASDDFNKEKIAMARNLVDGLSKMVGERRGRAVALPLWVLSDMGKLGIGMNDAEGIEGTIAQVDALRQELETAKKKHLASQDERKEEIRRRIREKTQELASLPEEPLDAEGAASGTVVMDGGIP